jgi:hypothetical protein
MMAASNSSESAAKGIPHQRRRRLGGRGGGAANSTATACGGVVINVSDCVSVNDLTIRAAIIAGLAILALVLTGWRKTARATPKTSRGTATTPRQVPIQVVREATPAYHAPNPMQRLFSLLASGGLALVVGAVIATAAIAVIVTTMTNLLKQ